MIPTQPIHITTLTPATELQDWHHGTVLIGNFDGLHKGHQALFDAIKQQNFPKPYLLLSFTPHPVQFFKPELPFFKLTSLAQKLSLLTQYNIDALLLMAFNQQCASLTPDEFISNILSDMLQAKAVITGDDFHFGKKRAGNQATLQQASKHYGFSYYMVGAQTGEDKQRFASRAIRNAIMQGDVALARNMLGRAYNISGEVIQGEQLGRTLNMPTANILPNDYCPPAYGIYAVTAKIAGDDTQYQAVSSFGTRPTVGGKIPLLEVHLIDFAGDIYGKHLSVDFHHYLRAEVNFPCLETLQSQMQQDLSDAKTYFTKTNCN
ncbi:MAG: bifunctional riboflavin kinase/FAD synthetase [Alphaproteobacteria bacterium]|nr:bifunctional riboflavin kinase/FAD synthetase [Alphaproteobacteria bacterium]